MVPFRTISIGYGALIDNKAPYALGCVTGPPNWSMVAGVGGHTADPHPNSTSGCKTNNMVLVKMLNCWTQNVDSNQSGLPLGWDSLPWEPVNGGEACFWLSVYPEL